MWYPIIFVLSIFLILVIVVRRAFLLQPPMHYEVDAKDRGEDYGNLPENLSDADSVEDKWGKAEQLYKDKKIFAAEKWYKDVLHEQPENDKAWARLGTIALNQKRYNSAVENLERSVEINPRVPSRQFNLALAYFMLKNKDHASACIEVALKSDPNKENYLHLKKNIEKM